jgi:DNA polymerase III epsilon subunit-like protein
MSGLIYYIIDTETNGLKADWHEIFQISIIRCQDRHQYSKYIRVEHPERSSEEALKITGRAVADLRTGSDKKTVVEQIDAWMATDGQAPEDRCIVGHNIAFDRRFCHALWASVGKKFPANNWLDTENIAKSWALKHGVERPKRLSLKAALEITQIKALPGAHDAISDARNTYLLWKCGQDEEIDHLLHIKRLPHE